MRVFAIAFVITLALTSFAETSSAQSSSSVYGQVCISDPYSKGSCWNTLPGATVRAFQSAGLVAGVGDVDVQTTTDGSGGYSLALEDGTYEMTVSRQGFETVKATVTVAGSTLRNFQLVGQEVSVSGTITDPSGNGVAGAFVEVYGEDYAEAKTDSDGAYALDTSSGYHSVRVRADGYRWVDDWRLVDGSALSYQLEALPPRDATVSGTIVDKAGNPIADAQVQASQWDYGESSYGYSQSLATTGADGTYTLKVYGGTGASIEASKESHTHRYVWLELAKNGKVTQDFTLVQIPEKTAQLSGKVVDRATDKGLGDVSISISWPEYGTYACTVYDGYDAPEPMPVEDSAGASSSSGSTGSADGERSSIAPGEPYYSACDITVASDGTISGKVYPGYAIVSVWYDSYRSGTQGPEYHSLTQVIALADGTNPLKLALKARAAPDAVLSGYIVDSTTNSAIAGAQVYINNEDTYGWGSATADKDGSYKAKLRAGYLRVSVYAEGYLPWEGNVEIGQGDSKSFDILLTPGESSYGGGCCYAYHDAAEGGPSAPQASGGKASVGDGNDGDVGTPGGTGSSDDSFEDLGGGLGPYNPARQNVQSDEKGSPALGVLLLMGALAVAVGLRRK